MIVKGRRVNFLEKEHHLSSIHEERKYRKGTGFICVWAKLGQRGKVHGGMVPWWENHA
jgi:hypothetical protein